MITIEYQDLDEWPCQNLHGGTGTAIYENIDGLCKHDACKPDPKPVAVWIDGDRITADGWSPGYWEQILRRAEKWIKYVKEQSS